MDASTLYIVDTSSFVNLQDWRPLTGKHHRIWHTLEELIRDQRLVSPMEVYEEIHGYRDALARWAVGHKKANELFKKSREYAGIAKQIIAKFPDLVDYDKPGPQADPFVVALAEFEKRKTLGHKSVIVTEETFKPGRTRIPHVCASYNLQYMTIHQMYIAQGLEL